MLTTCTLTGIDEATPLPRIAELSRRHPFVEWGVLYSESQAGKGRYPSFEWISRLIELRQGNLSHTRMALHICGRRVADFLMGQGHVTWTAERFDRVQVNFIEKDHDPSAVRAMLARNAGKTIITQHNAANADLWKTTRDLPNHAFLFDASGGRGIEAEGWPEPLPGRLCGYAGGIGPDNVVTVVDAVARVAGDADHWIDMEGKMRIEDRFDVSLASKVLEAVAPRISRSSGA